MKTGPKYKVCRRLGSNVFEKCQTQQYVLSETKHAKSARRGRAPSNFGKQLMEKQRIRFAYGVQERQLRRYIEEAGRRAQGVDPATRMLELLETRLDNVVFRAGFATSRRQARQLVTHGHVTVNGRKIDVPSYEVKHGDKLAVREGSKSKPYFANNAEKIEGATAPNWLKVDSKALLIEATAKPSPENTDMVADLNTVLEFYSR